MRLLFFLLVSGLLFVGCSDTERMDRLEAEIRAVKSDTRREVQGIRDAVAADAGSDGVSLVDRISNLEKQLLENTQTGKVAYLRQGANGHATMDTDHGTFLIRLESINLDPEGQGFIARLNIGNIGALTIQQFVLSGDFGSGVPQLADGQEYSVYNQQIEEWQKTLKPFQYRVARPLRPMAWTTMDLMFDAKSRDDLELIRFSMQIENAHLDNVPVAGSAGGSNSSDDKVAHIRVDSKSAALLKTDYGAFLVVVKDALPSGDGTRLDLEIGNPYSFIVDECNISGTFGSSLPQRQAAESDDQFLNRLREWTAQQKPFESTVAGKLKPGKWSSASILVPGSVEDVKFLRAGLTVKYVTLPQK